tara:strand:- start:2478 stop:2717 length:240 start_codon:yes stop_codon:yes gene_type:complete
MNSDSDMVSSLIAAKYRREKSGNVYEEKEYLKILEETDKLEAKKPRGRPRGSLNGVSRMSKQGKFSFKVVHETFLITFD